MVIAVFDPVQSALTGALSVLQVPAADLRECVLGIGELYLLSAGEGAVAVAVGDHQCAAALDELDELGIVDLRADNDNADTVVLLGVGLAAFYLLKRLAQIWEDESLGAGVADQNQNGVLIAGDGRDIQLAQLAYLGEDAADLIVLAHGGADGVVRGVDAVVFVQGLQNLSGDLLADVLDAVLVVGIGNVQIAVEELVLVFALRVQDLHVLDGAVIRLADVNAYHGVEKSVAALKCALQQRPGELTAVVGHVIGGQLHRVGMWGTEPDRETVPQVQQHLRRMETGVTDGQVPLCLRFPHKLVVCVFQKILKVDQMLQFFHCRPSFYVLFFLPLLCQLY